MPRVARGLAGGMIYHVINRGNGRQNIFHKDDDYRAFIDLLAEAKVKHPVKVFGYCLMTNHFHLLLSPEQADDLSKFMQWLMTSHVRRYHRHYQSSGHVWQGRYKSFVIEQDNHLLTVVRYIEGNPVRANLVLSALDWSWSSHGERATGITRLVDDLPLPVPAFWTEYVNTPLTESEVEKLQQSMHRGAPYGSLEWRDRVCECHGLESTIRPRGRPKNEDRKK